jgi:hypothetical protein
MSGDVPRSKTNEDKFRALRDKVMEREKERKLDYVTKDPAALAALDYNHSHNHVHSGNSYIAPNTWWTDSSGIYPPMGSGSAATKISHAIKETTPMKQYIVGNGKATSFTYPANTALPSVRVFNRDVDGEGDEQVITLTENRDAVVSIVPGDSITVEFAEAPAKRAAVIAIG